MNIKKLYREQLTPEECNSLDGVMNITKYFAASIPVAVLNHVLFYSVLGTLSVLPMLFCYIAGGLYGYHETRKSKKKIIASHGFTGLEKKLE